MKAPTIHANGTSERTLLRDADEFEEALQNAIEAGRNMAPNGRDYYPQGPDALTEANAAFADLMHRLVAVQNEVREYMEAVVSYASA